MHSRLAIDTTVNMTAGPSSAKPRPQQRSISPSSAGPSNGREFQNRGRSISNASTASSLSIVSPTSSSTNASTTSLILPSSRNGSRSRSASPAIDDTVRLGPEYVLAMHDYFPQHQNSTCLSFRAGQVIHVLNRDSSGWWDGELEGRRGWFPSNYVNAEITSLTEEEPLGLRSSNRGHGYSYSSASTTSWTTISSNNHASQHRRDSSTASESSNQEMDGYCPPFMLPLLQGLSLLQNAVHSNRITHFQPSTACIISCVRGILANTGTLARDAPILQDFPALMDQRKAILTILVSLVAQAKKASEVNPNKAVQTTEVEKMLRLGGQVFSHVRTFLAVAVKCGIEFPTEEEMIRTATPGSEGAQKYIEGEEDSPTRTPTQYRGRNAGTVPRPGGRIVGPRSRERPQDVNTSPSLTKSLARAKQEQYLLRDRAPTRHKPGSSVSSISSSSSFSSQESMPSSPPPFPCGPSTSQQVMEALRFTHDHYLSTIAAFIGHAHSHSRTSYASSTGVLYDLVKEIVEMVCKLLTIVEAVMQHPDIPPNRVSNLKSAKEGLYNVTSSLAESVRLLTLSLPPTMSEEAEKQILLRSATGALKAGADCVSAVKLSLSRSGGDKPFIVNLPNVENVIPQPFTPLKPNPISLGKSLSEGAGTNGYHLNGMEDEDLTIQAQTPSPVQRSSPAQRPREISSGSDNSLLSKSSWLHSDETRATSPDEGKLAPIVIIPHTPVEPDLASPTSPISIGPTDEDGTTWEGSHRGHVAGNDLEEKIVHGELPDVPVEAIGRFGVDPSVWMFGHDYSLEDVAYNSDGHLVGATMEVLVEKMTPHDSIVDPAFAAIFFLTFRLFSSPSDLVDALIARYNLLPPEGISAQDVHIWQQRKGIPVRLRVSNFIKTWVELYWRSGVDDVVIPVLTTFTEGGLANLFPTPAQRILDLLNMRKQSSDLTISPKADRTRDPGMSINPPMPITPTSEIPRPTMTKTLLVSLRKKDFANIAITDFDALELARQLTIMECNLYCAIQPEEILESGQEGATPPVNVRAVSSLSTVITGWVAESILNEPDIKRRTALVKFFVKVADRCTGLDNFSTSRSILAALDSSVISRLHQTWFGLPQKYKVQLESLRRLADHSRNYHEYRSKLRNTAPPAVPFLGLYLTDVTFCREGNPSHRASPSDPSKKLLNFNKYHKLARIVQDMQRFQAPYNLKAIPEVQEYLNVAFEKSKHHGDLQDLYRRSLLVEPKQPADQPPTSDMRQLFNWATRSQSQQATSSS